MTPQEEYIKYLADLLIIQYRNKPKARKTIESIASLYPTDAIFAVRDGFNIDTAKGVQLDTLGEYVGIDRYWLKEGVVTELNDEDYRTLIKLKIISNHSNLSHKEIDDSLYRFFGNQVRADSTGDMSMVLTVPTGRVDIIYAALQKGALPRPMGVKLQNIIEQSSEYFGYCTYSNPENYPYSTGFMTYDEPTKKGEMLDYEKTINTGDL